MSLNIDLEKKKSITNQIQAKNAMSRLVALFVFSFFGGALLNPSTERNSDQVMCELISYLKRWPIRFESKITKEKSKQQTLCVLMAPSLRNWTTSLRMLECTPYAVRCEFDQNVCHRPLRLTHGICYPLPNDFFEHSSN